MQPTTQEIHGLVFLLTGSARMAVNISADYTETLQQLTGVTIDADRWLVLTLISYGYDVDRFKPASSPAATRTRGTLRPDREQIRAALLTVRFPERFCFLLRYALGWEIARIARLMLCDVPRIELAITEALCRIRETLLVQSGERHYSEGHPNAQHQAR